jgi:hypothetical protein
MEIKKVAKGYVVIGNETIWFDESFDEIPLKEDFEKWLKNIKKILEKTVVT